MVEAKKDNINFSLYIYNLIIYIFLLNKKLLNLMKGQLSGCALDWSICKDNANQVTYLALWWKKKYLKYFVKNNKKTGMQHYYSEATSKAHKWSKKKKIQKGLIYLMMFRSIIEKKNNNILKIDISFIFLAYNFLLISIN